VLGVNGAGRSTLLRCLNRILRPRTGTLSLLGEDLLRMDRREVARNIGYVPQRSGESRMTVYEAVLLGRKPHIRWSLRPSDHSRVENILTRMGLAGLALRSVDELSGGEFQKVVVARALAQSPRLLLLDEPTSSLDLKNQVEILGLVREIAVTENLSAVVSIHDLNLALRFSDRFLLLKEHRIHAAVGREALTADLVAEVFGIDVVIHEVNGIRVVVPV